MRSKLHKTQFKGMTISAFLIVEGDMVSVQLDHELFPLVLVIDKFDVEQCEEDTGSLNVTLKEAEIQYFDSVVIELFNLSLLLANKLKCRSIMDTYQKQISAMGSQYISSEKYKIIKNKVSFIRGMTTEERRILSDALVEANRFSRDLEKSLLSVIFTDEKQVFNKALFSQFTNYVEGF